MTATLQNLINDVKAARERMQAEGKNALGQALDQFFESCPEVRCITWAQYAPYFNDGDPCVFSVDDPKVQPFANKVEPDMAEALADYDGCMFGWSDSGPYALERELNERERAILAQWNTIKPAFSEHELFKLTFGDDCQVVASREGFEISEYEHD